MSAYMIVESTIKDPERYQEYTSKVPETIARYGGRYLARGSHVTALSDLWRPERLILLEFPGEEEIRAWLASPEYLRLAPLREAGAATRAVIIEGTID